MSNISSTKGMICKQGIRIISVGFVKKIDLLTYVTLYSELLTYETLSFNSLSRSCVDLTSEKNILVALLAPTRSLNVLSSALLNRTPNLNNLSFTEERAGKSLESH